MGHDRVQSDRRQDAGDAFPLVVQIVEQDNPLCLHQQETEDGRRGNGQQIEAPEKDISERTVHLASITLMTCRA